MTKAANICFFINKLLFVFFLSIIIFTTHASQIGALDTSIAPMPVNSEYSACRNIKFFIAHTQISPDSALKIAKKNLYKSSKNDVFASVTNIHQPIWLYFKIGSFSVKDEHLLVLENCNFNLVSFYKYDIAKDHLTLIGSKGMGMPYQSDNLFPEQISFLIEENSIYFIEAYDFTNASFPLYVRTNTINAQKSVLLNFFNAFYWGVISVMAITALFFFIRSKERVFIYYSLFLFGTILLNLCLDGYLFAYAWPNNPEINAYKFAIYATSALSTPFFVYYYLDINTYFPNRKYLFTTLTISFLIVIILNIFRYYVAAMYFIQLIGFIQIIIFLVYGLKIWRKGNENALYFILAWSAYLLSILFAIFSAADIIPSTSFVNNYVQIGTLIQGAIFSFIIAGKYQEYKLKHIQSQEKFIEVLKEREYLLTNQNDTLEATVVQRTKELEQTNDELNNLNKNLNEVVALKTLELKKSIDEINDTNKQLEQFNFITSHNLRGPITTLKGLFELYYQEQNDDERQVYIDKGLIVVNRMDEILKDLNKILSYKSSERIKERIDFETIVSNNLRQLDIKRIKANLYVNPSLEILGIKSFYESIFYNLFSNAQKYKSPDRELRIDIQINKLTDNICSIKISDNGIGMDTSKIGDKLFGFYKRFHFHVEGKGLGLYITKSQVEMLGGTIRVESTLHEGTTFIIELPC